VTDCEGRGEKPCPTCNAGQEHGFYKANQMTRCSACHGRGLLAHQDGSDSVLVVLLIFLRSEVCSSAQSWNIELLDETHYCSHVS
jgi:hypothetical protein